jgi:transposase-like protein
VEDAGRSDPEVPEKAQRRRFTAEYKLGILEAADACRGPGEVGALLRREGLYTSNLNVWRQQRQSGALNGLRPSKRGRKPRRHPEAKRIEQLERENRRLREELRKAQVIIDVQKKVAHLLGRSEAIESEESS